MTTARIQGEGSSPRAAPHAFMCFARQKRLGLRFHADLSEQSGFPRLGLGAVGHFLASFAVSAFLLVGGSCHARPFSIHVDGKLVEGIERAGVHTTNEYSFSADVQDCKWFLRLVPLNPDYSANRGIPGGQTNLVGVPDEIVASSDSEFFYYFQTFNRYYEKMIALGAIPKQHAPNNGFARRGPGSVPYAIDNKLIALWYAFASHCHFEREPKPMALPPMQEMAAPFYAKTNFFVEGEWQLLEEAPKLPRYIISSNSCNFPADLILSFFRSKMPNTNVIYETMESLRVGEFTIAKAAVVTYFSFDYPGGKVVNRIVGRSQIMVEKANLGSQIADFKPPFPGTSFFDDLRPWKSGGAAAFTAHSWPGDEIVNAAAACYDRLEASNRPRHAPIIKFFILLTVIAVPVLFLITNKYKQKVKAKLKNET